MGLTVLFFGLSYRPTVLWLWERAVSADSYYSHAFLIPLISGYLIWRKREAFRLPFEPSRWGLILIFCGLGIHLLSVLLDVYFSSGYSVILVLFGISLHLFGKRTTREMLFPLGFLVFMVPMPMAAEGALAIPMKTLATKAAAASVGFLGVPVVREGFQLYFPSALLVVGNPCSGLRSLIALMALGSLFAYFYQAVPWKRLALFFVTIPIAAGSNIVRVIVLSLVANQYGSKAATGPVHELSGILVFIVALALLVGVRKALEWNPSKNAGER